MKRVICFSVLFMVGISFAGTQIVQEMAKGWRTGTVSVSTTTPSTVTCGQTTMLPGRYKIQIQNISTAYEVAIATWSNFSYANGYIISESTDIANANIILYLQGGSTVYALGQSQNVSATVQINCIEFR